MKRFMDRRQILLHAGAWILYSCRSSAPGSALKGEEESPKDNPSLRVRRAWKTGEGREFQLKFIQAVAWLKANDDKVFPVGDPRAWLSWKKLASTHAQSAPEMNWFFLPWHRLYLRYFEAACRYALRDETFALPYWDWTNDPSVFPEFSENDLLNANRDWKKTDRLAEEFVGPQMIDRLLAAEDFFAFHSGSPTVARMVALPEGACHHRVRNAIGGDMLGLAAANDPLFWLHHANIDRLWTLWSLRHPDSVLPPLGEGQKPEAWLGSELQLNFTEVLQGKDQPISRAMPLPPVPAHGSLPAFPAKMLVKDVLQSEALGYSYDSVAAEPAVFINLNIAPSRRSSKVFTGESRLHANALISKLSVDPNIKSARAVRDSQGSASLILLNLPSDRRVQIRFFAFDGAQYRDDQIAELSREDAWKRSEWLGSWSSFVPKDLPKSRQEKNGLSLNIDVGEWFRKNPNTKDIILVALASEAQDQRPVDFFALSTLEVQLQLNSSDK